MFVAGLSIDSLLLKKLCNPLQNDSYNIKGKWSNKCKPCLQDGMKEAEYHSDENFDNATRLTMNI